MTTTRRLLLMRHAKSDWADEELSDHDRPLNKRGRRDAPTMAEWIRQSAGMPDRILCSSSTRTCETARLLIDTWRKDVPLTTSTSLYLASPEGMVDVIEADGGDAEVLLVIAHNPGTAALVSGLAGRYIDMPTAAVGVFDVVVSPASGAEFWSGFGSSDQVSLADFAKPKELA